MSSFCIPATANPIKMQRKAIDNIFIGNSITLASEVKSIKKFENAKIDNKQSKTNSTFITRTECFINLCIPQLDDVKNLFNSELNWLKILDLKELNRPLKFILGGATYC